MYIIDIFLAGTKLSVLINRWSAVVKIGCIEDIKHKNRIRKGPFTLAIFAAILAAFLLRFRGNFAAISRRVKLLAIQIAAESPVDYTNDLKSP